MPVAWRKRDASRSGGCSRAQDGVICKETGTNNRFRELKAGAVGNASHHWTQAPVSLEKFGANKTDRGKAEEESLVDVGWVVGSLAGGTQFTAVCQPARKTQRGNQGSAVKEEDHRLQGEAVVLGVSESVRCWVGSAFEIPSSVGAA